MGSGPMSGRQLGYCAGYDAPGYARGGTFGCGMGRGRGRAFGAGRGMAFRHGGWEPAPAYGNPVAPPTTEAAQLKAQIDGLEKTLNALKKRLDSIEGEVTE